MNNLTPMDSAIDRYNSVADLHYRLGKLVEDGPGVLQTRDGRRHNTNRRVFEDIEPVGFVDMSAAERLEDWAADHLASLSPERRAELELEWQDENPGLPTMEERAASMAAVRARLDAHPLRQPTPAQIAQAQREADEAVGKLLGFLAKGQRNFRRSGL